MSGYYRFGLIGSNIGNSLSPMIFDLLFFHFGITGEFIVYDWDTNDFADGMDTLRKLDGFSVTRPFKEAILPYMDAIDETAMKIQAVNSVRVEDGKFIGGNTDREGFLYPLESIGEFNRITVIGYGGAARAVVYALLTRFEGAYIYIGGRSRVKIDAFVADMGSIMPNWNKRLMGLDENTLPTEPCDLLVNCTPVGNGESPQSCPVADSYDYKKARICYDLIYRPETTEFLRRAALSGCRTINGLPMLFSQAAASFALWTGEHIDRASVCNELLMTYTRQNQGAH